MEENTIIKEPDLSVLPGKGMFIDGKYVIDPSGDECDHIYSATGKVTTSVPMAGPKGVEIAIQSAQKALPAWRDMPVPKRQAIMTKLGELYAANKDRVTRLCTIENGMLTKVAKGFLQASVPWFSYYAGYADKSLGEVDEINPKQNISIHIREPYGIVAVILPFNAPVHSVCKQISAALVVGNCVIMKPSSVTPFLPSLVAELFIEAGGPPGVFNVIPCRGDIGEMICSHPGVDMIHLTGSTAAGKAVMAAAAKNITPVGMELGGKSPAVIFDDADLEAACKSVADATIMLAGQVCAKQSRILVQAGVYEKVIEMSKKLVEKTRVGDPANDSTDMGPIVSEAQCNEVMGYIKRAKQAGDCRLILGGNRLGGSLSGGYFIEPTIFADVKPDSELYRKEVFGPVTTFTKFETEEEAVRMANDTNYGLAASVFTSDYKRMNRVALQIEAGTVAINGRGRSGHPGHPFGGFKESGFSGIGGVVGLNKYTRVKTMVTMI
jgi:acyl-CoA reductase-like NAD-dependent aldehyde dehydrogenase